jgi:hypothetical protein
MTRVVHCQQEDYDIYIGRGRCPKTGKPGKFGNDWSHKPGLAKHKVNSLGEALFQYNKDLEAHPELVAQIVAECKDQTLGCWCKPKRGFRGRVLCHGQIIAAKCDGCQPSEIP